MKQLSCKQMGGPCDEEIKGNTKEELSKNGMEHLKAVHPEMAADMEKMTPEQGQEWMDKTLTPLWDAAPEM